MNLLRSFYPPSGSSELIEENGYCVLPLSRKDIILACWDGLDGIYTIALFGVEKSSCLDLWRGSSSHEALLFLQALGIGSFSLIPPKDQKKDASKMKDVLEEDILGMFGVP